MTYQVEVFRCGESVEAFDGIEALNSLEAIERIESRYDSVFLGLDKNGKEVWWSGYEFQARQLGMVLS
jgi:hypothetical protein